MKIEIEVETWHQAHHLGCILSDAEWKFRQNGLTEYADFFKRVAQAVTKQAEPLNQKLWEERAKRGK